jgi:hypothetical protein
VSFGFKKKQNFSSNIGLIELALFSLGHKSIIHYTTTSVSKYRRFFFLKGSNITIQAIFLKSKLE